MKNLMLKILSALIAVLILLVVALKLGSIEIGVRTSQNLFTSQIANLSLTTWLLVILLLIELVLVPILYFSSKARV
jgi:hypothetical protein